MLLLKAYLFYKGLHQEKPRIILFLFCIELFMPLTLLDFKFLNGQELCDWLGLFPLLGSSVFMYNSKQKITREQQHKTSRYKMVIS